MFDYVEHLEVKRLFGRLNQTVDLRPAPDQVTILTGPNGSGKTHILKLLRASAGADMPALSVMPFESVTVTYRSGKQLRVQRQEVDERKVQLVLTGTKGGKPLGRSFEWVYPEPALLGDLPPYIRRVDEDTWMDRRDGEILTLNEVVLRYGLSRHQMMALAERSDRFSEELPDWFKSSFVAVPGPTMIETSRLDLISPAPERRGPGRRRPEAEARIRQYVERIRELVNNARRSSLSVSQRLDREFAARALDKAQETAAQSELRSRYERLSALHQELHSNGLTAESLGVAFPSGETNSTERRILNLFLDDWEKKLEPLTPIHTRLQVFREIVGTKLKDKHLDFSRGELDIRTSEQEPLPVERLSSGEQHLIALFAMLLFDAAPGSLVLIDEPEISLHAAWKHSFLPDVRRVAQISSLQLVLATHSTAIINGEWDLVEELFLTA